MVSNLKQFGNELDFALKQQSCQSIHGGDVARINL